MQVKEFLAAPCGRLFLATSALALAAAGIFAITAQSPLLAIALVSLACVVSSIFYLAMAAERFPLVTVALVIGLPIVGGIYFAGLHVVAKAGVGAGIGFVALALVCAWAALRRTGSVIGRRATAPQSGDSHAAA